MRLLLLSTALVFLIMAPLSGYAEYHCQKTNGQSCGTLSTTTRIVARKKLTVLSLRQFCFSFGCKVLYQWGRHRAVVQNPVTRTSAILSMITRTALVDGFVLGFKDRIPVDSHEGYMLPIDLATKLASALRLGTVRYQEDVPSPLVKSGKNMPSSFKTLVIDPGHGGNDWGTGFGGIYEKDIAVLYAIKLREELKREIPDLTILLTREDDRYVSLPDRAKIANSKEANLFLSLHVNHAQSPRVEGIESYILSTDATDDDAKKVALIENDTWLKSAQVKEAGATVQKILADVEQTRYIQDSALAASLIQQELAGLDKTSGLKNRGVKQAMFYVLSQVAMPSTLVEMGFLSNTGDRSRLMDLAFRDAFIKKLVAALRRYRDRFSKEN